MDKLTEKEYETLISMEHMLYTAVTSSYVRGLDSSTFNDMAVIYKRVYNYIGTLTSGCNSCVMNVCRGLYYAIQEYKKDQEKTLLDGKRSRSKKN